ncbi:YdeI/OmpD-associated family protein [Agarivorans aestuarii]|uniref:YdeI/OmpD-associated family protein n=1 Tax=Agarivorans aestuarii TaxID=1563703 RepID=UPI001C8171F3|nr:YdeI/OmpD-associated family protein [Agarivorans aestuarii]
MPDPNLKKVVSFARPQELCKWLQEHHATESELWINIFKKHTGTPSVTWDDVVVESLCWGWIDGIKKSVDEQSYLQRITPRKPRSNWSKRNRQHVERLIQEGRMTPFGLLHVDAAKADGRWKNAYSVSEMEVPKDFLAALELEPNAQQFFASLTKSNRYVIAHGLLSAKRPETRQKRFAKYLDLLARNEKPT